MRDPLLSPMSTPRRALGGFRRLRNDLTRLTAALLLAACPADPADVDPPTAPTGVVITALSEHALLVAWVPSTDDVGVVGYEVAVDGVVRGNSAAAAWTDEDVPAGRTRCYTVTALDAAGNGSAPSAPGCGAPDWLQEVVEEAGYGVSIGMWTRLAFDSANRAHVAYSAFVQFGDFRHAVREAGGWTIEHLFQGGSGDDPAWLALAVDGLHRPHIAWHHPSAIPNYVPATLQVTAPGLPTATVSDGGTQPSIALDAAGARHVAFYDAPGQRLAYATDASGDWTIEVVDDDGDTGWYPSLALDDAGFAHIAYHAAAPDGDLRYATNASGSWATETVAADGFVGAWPALGLTDDGVAIAYQDVAHADLWLATGAPGDWTTELLDDDGEVGLWTDLAVGPDGALHVVTYEASAGDLRYATDVGGAWAVQTLRDEGDVGAYASVALDVDGAVWIACRADNAAVVVRQEP